MKITCQFCYNLLCNLNIAQEKYKINEGGIIQCLNCGKSNSINNIISDSIFFNKSILNQQNEGKFEKT